MKDHIKTVKDTFERYDLMKSLSGNEKIGVNFSSDKSDNNRNIPNSKSSVIEIG